MWRTFRAAVVSPRSAMVGLAADPRARRNGIALVLVVELAATVLLALQAQFDYPPAEGVLFGYSIAAVLGLSGASAFSLYIMSRGGSYASAFGRFAFAYTVPTASTSSPLNTAITLLVVLGAGHDIEPLDWLPGAVALPVVLWSLVLSVLAIRASVRGRVAVTSTLVLDTRSVARRRHRPGCRHGAAPTRREVVA